MKLFFLITLFLLQNSIYRSPTEITQFQKDNVGHFYIIQGDNIIMTDKKGKTLFAYSNPKLGTITSMHQTSGLRTMLFYQDLSTFLILDNTLSLQTPAVNLENNGLNLISLICTSENNSYWCYSEEDKSVIRITQQLMPISKSANLEVTLNKPCSPTQILEKNGWIYLNDPKNGIHVFDNFGNYDKTLPILDCDKIDVQGDALYYLQKNNIWKFNMKNFIEETMVNDSGEIEDFVVDQNGIFIQKNNEIFLEKKSP